MLKSVKNQGSSIYRYLIIKQKRTSENEEETQERGSRSVEEKER